MVTRETPSTTMIRMLFGYRITRALHTAVALGIIDALGDSAQTAGDLAQASNTDTLSLRRLLRFLVSIGVMSEEIGDRFALTPLGATLRQDVPGSVRALAMLQFDERLFDSWGQLQHSVKTGEPAFDYRFGTDVWTYRAQDLEYSQLFDAAMAGSVQLINATIVASYDFSSFGNIVDVGGGNGALLIAILQANPGTRGMVFDQPHVVSGAEPRIAAAGLADRLEAVGGNFLESVPAGADVYLLSRILHDWDDARSIDILKTIRRAMPPHSKVLVIERVIPDRIEAAPSYQDIMMSDLNMLVMTGGRERTQAEFAALFKASELRLARIVPTQATTSIVEAVPE